MVIKESANNRVSRNTILIHQQLPATQILLLGIFPRGQKPNPNREKITEINQIITQLNGHDNITFLDFGANFIGEDGTVPKSIMPDFLHPNNAGYQIWADAMEATLVRLLGQYTFHRQFEHAVDAAEHPKQTLKKTEFERNKDLSKLILFRH